MIFENVGLQISVTAKNYSSLTSRKLALATQFKTLFLALSLMFIASICLSSTAKAGWGPGNSPSPGGACATLWHEVGMDKGNSVLLGGRISPNNPNVFNCDWSYNGYLCPMGGCGTVVPNNVFLTCATGQTAVNSNCQGPSTPIAPRHPCSCPIDGNPNPAVGDPVILSTGEVFLKATDYASADGRFSFTRAYRTQPIGPLNVLAVPFGLDGRWQFDFMMELQLGFFYGQLNQGSATGGATVIAPDGTSHLFNMQSNGTFVTGYQGYIYHPADSDYSIKFVGTLPADLSTLPNTATQWQVTDKDGRVWLLKTMQLQNKLGPGYVNLNTIARPIKITDRDGYSRTLTYATDGSLTSIVDSFGRTMTVEWYRFTSSSPQDPNAASPYPEVISAINLPDGTKLQYIYDPAGTAVIPSVNHPARLVQVKRLNADQTVADSTTYAYENTTYPNYLTGVTDNRNSRIATYAYDTAGRAISTVGANGADTYTISYSVNGSVNTARVVNPLGKATNYNFFDYANGTHQWRLQSVNQEASANTPATTKSYAVDPNTLLVNSETDEEGRVTNYVRDAFGRPTSITRGSGTAAATTKTITYHATFNAPTQVVEPGLTTTFAYDAGGRLTGVTKTDTTCCSPLKTGHLHHG